MRVVVQLFGPLAERAGKPRLEVGVSGTTVGDILAAVARSEPGLRLDASVRVAVNTDYADAATPVKEGDVVSLIPPVGGG